MTSTKMYFVGYEKFNIVRLILLLRFYWLQNRSIDVIVKILDVTKLMCLYLQLLTFNKTQVINIPAGAL